MKNKTNILEWVLKSSDFLRVLMFLFVIDVFIFLVFMGVVK